MPTRTEVPATATPASPSATPPGNDGGISGSIASQSQSVSPDAADAAAAGSPPPTNVNRHSQSQSDEDDHEDNEAEDDGLLFSCRCESARSVTTLLSCLRHVASGGGGSGTSDFALTQGALAAGRRSRADLSLSAIDHTGISGGRGGGIGGGGGGRGGSGRAQHATVFAGEAGLTFHVHGTARQSQASVDMQSGLFSDYYVCEQVVEVDGEEQIQRARLDVVFNNQNAQRAYIDVCVPAAFSTCPELLRARAARDGAAAGRAEDGKRLRYPGPDLVPFAVEALGRPGADAVALLRACAPEDPADRSQVLGSAWQSLSALLQTQNAELLMAAESA